MLNVASHKSDVQDDEVDKGKIIKLLLEPVLKAGEGYYKYYMDFNKALKHAKDFSKFNMHALGQLSQNIFQGAVGYLRALSQFVRDTDKAFFLDKEARKLFDECLDDMTGIPTELYQQWEVLCQHLKEDPLKVTYATMLDNHSDQLKYQKITSHQLMFNESLKLGKIKIDQLQTAVDKLKKEVRLKKGL